MLQLIRLRNKLLRRKPGIYQIKLMDGLICEIKDIEWVQDRNNEYRFFTSGKDGPVLICPKANVSNIQAMEAVDDNREELESETRINNAIPPEPVRMQILNDGKKEVARFLLRKESGRVWIWDSEKDVFTSVDEQSEGLAREIVGMANADHQGSKLNGYKDARNKEAAIHMIVTDVDEKPALAISNEHWGAMLRNSTYKPIMAPVVEDGKGAQYHFNQEEKQVTLTRCLLTVEGDNVRRQDMDIPS